MTEFSGRITVICKVCGTRLDAGIDDVGSDLVCPDCYTKNRVERPKNETPADPNSAASDDDFEYKLAEGSDQPVVDSAPTVSLICTTCHSLLHAPENDIGKKIQCHDCDSWNVIPRPRKIKKVNAPELDPQANMPIGEAALTADHNRQDYAKRLIEEAHEEIQRVEDEASRQIDENTSLFTGILLFPCYPNVIPIWAGLTFGMIVVGAMTTAINYFMDSGGFAMVLSAAIAALGGMTVITLLGAYSTKLLAVVEYTSSGQVDIDEFPQSDLLERAFGLVLILNALAISFLPEILFGNSLGIRGLVGGITSMFVFPVLLLSLLDNGSLWIPISKEVYGSLVEMPFKWILFWLASFIVLVATIAISFMLVLIGNVMISIFVASVVNAFSILVYARMLGWMGWYIGSIPLDQDTEEDDDDEVDDEDDRWED